MKILLVRPFVPHSKRLNVVPPIGLGYLSSALRKEGFDAEIVDCVAREYQANEFTKFIDEKKPSVIGFQTYSQDVNAVNQCIDIAKKLNPSTIIIVGGPHPSGVGKEIFKHLPKIDFAFCGESEKGLVSLASLIDKRKEISDDELVSVPGLLWKSKDAIKSNDPIFVKELDEFDFPDWDFIDPRTYPGAPQGIIFKNLPVAPVIATRGCPCPCSFCAGHTVTGRLIRKRSVKNVIAEIELLNKKYGVKEIHIVDDNFSSDKNYVKEFCEALLEKDLGISWCCPNGLRLDTLTEDMVILMKKAGCYYISLGIESGVDRILKAMRKNITVELITKKVNMIKGTGLDVNGFFIIGYPGETEADILETIKFAKRLPLTRTAFHIFLPLPNTEAYRKLIESGDLKEPDWNTFAPESVPYVAQGFTKPQLEGLQRKAQWEFYLRLKTMFSLLTKIKSFSQIVYIMKRVVLPH